VYAEIQKLTAVLISEGLLHAVIAIGTPESFDLLYITRR